MASSPHPHSHFALALHLFLLLAATAAAAAAATAPAALNVTAILAAHPDFSEFSRLLASTTVAADLSGRSSLTLLAVPNLHLLRSADLLSAAAADLADVIRYHVLLQYLSWPDLRRLPPSGQLVTTLYQTTGRAPSDLGALNLTRSPSGAVTALAPSSNATVLAPVASLPYNISVLSVTALLLPYGFDLAASETRPPPVGVNITRVLVDARDFNVAAAMLEASGVAEEFEADENGAGITVFVPTDEAFADLASTERRLQSLPAGGKATVLRFHVLHSYYPLGSLESIVNPVQPTLATEVTGAGRFTLDIGRVNGSVAIDTSVVRASITRTVFDQNPVAVFAVDRVLLPREIFGRESRGDVVEAGAPPPAVTGGIAPEGAETPPTRLSSPPGARAGAEASAAVRRRWGAEICTGLLYLLLLLV